MQICHITSVHPRYDIRIFIKECQTLAQEHQVSLVVADSLGDEVKDGIAIYDVGKVSGGRLRRMWVTRRAILTKVLQLQPQVVHFHDPELLGIGCKLAKLGIKVIYDVHEDVPKQILNKHWIPRWLRPVVSKLVSEVERYSATQVSGVIAATEIIAARFKQYNSQCVAIHNYPIIAELGQVSSNWEQRQNRACYLGSISATRGIVGVVDSLAVSGIPLDLAGPYSNEQVKQQIQASPGYALVNYHGVINREQVANLLAQVRYGIVTLLPTPSYLESLPIKLFEYMLAGIPVIASNFPLWQPIVSGHNCGLLVNPEDAKQIADACLWLQQHPELAQKMGENGRQAVLKQYSWDAEARQLLFFYRKLGETSYN